MQGKITLEDHFATTTTLGNSQIFGAHVWSELGPRLLDFQDKRLRLMDAAGIEIMIASLNAPAIQAIADIQRAVDVAREANDVLAQQIAKRPDRFAISCASMSFASRATSVARLVSGSLDGRGIERRDHDLDAGGIHKPQPLVLEVEEARTQFRPHMGAEDLRIRRAWSWSRNDPRA